MDELESLDRQRRQIIDEFSVLHARFHLLHEHYRQQVKDGEGEEERRATQRTQKVADYNARSLALQTTVSEEQAKITTETSALATLDQLKRQYDKDEAAKRAVAVDGLPAAETRLIARRERLQ